MRRHLIKSCSSYIDHLIQNMDCFFFARADSTANGKWFIRSFFEMTYSTSLKEWHLNKEIYSRECLFECEIVWLGSHFDIIHSVTGMSRIYTESHTCVIFNHNALGAHVCRWNILRIEWTEIFGWDLRPHKFNYTIQYHAGRRSYSKYIKVMLIITKSKWHIIELKLLENFCPDKKLVLYAL